MPKATQRTQTIKAPCEACPWRVANHGKRHHGGFYTKKNLNRLWNGLRTGKAPGMTCHPTDPSHPLHGAKPDSTPQECQGALILVMREIVMANQSPERYMLRSALTKGLTKQGMTYWGMMRSLPPALGGSGMPSIEGDPELVNSPEFGRLER